MLNFVWCFCVDVYAVRSSCSHVILIAKCFCVDVHGC